MRRERKRRPRGFARAKVPPEKFHTTKRGKRGYSRRRSRQEERDAKGEEGKEGAQEIRLAPTNLRR